MNDNSPLTIEGKKMNDNNDTLDQGKKVGKLVPALPALHQNTYERFFKRQLYASKENETKAEFNPVQISLEEAVERNLRKEAIFWTVQQVSGRRVTGNVKGILSWAIESDSLSKEEQWARVKSSPLTPSLVVESKKSLHLYWHAKDATKERFEEIERDRLLPFFGGDIKSTLFVQLLRVPGFFHWKEADNPFLCKVALENDFVYTEEEMLRAFPPCEKARGRELEKRRNYRKSGISQETWIKLFSLNCEEALIKLSGTEAIQNQTISFKETRNSNLNILVDGAGTSCWIDQKKLIGSRDQGGPTIWDWLMWHWKDPKKVKKLIQTHFPEVFKVSKNTETSDVNCKLLESAVVTQLVAQYADDLIRQKDLIYQYRENHWAELPIEEENAIKREISEIYSGSKNYHSLISAWKAFQLYLPTLPEGKTLSQSAPNCINFLDGALFLEQSFKGKSTEHALRFEAGHRKTDFISNVLPYNYLNCVESENIEFIEMMNSLFAHDPDGLEKYRAIQQMFGASLMPAFSHLFFLVGNAGTGKSTIQLILSWILSQENMCSVDPTEFEGFGMETMVGKLVNIVDDVETEQRLSEAMLKKVLSQTPVRIRRKGLKDVYGKLPPIHVFSGNELPPMYGRSRGAHDRRWSIIEFKKGFTQGHFDRNYARWVFEKNPEGIVNFALGGLKDLIEQEGHFINPESGKNRLKAWTTDKDPVALFLMDIEEGEVGYGMSQVFIDKENKGALILRSELWKCFSLWMTESGHDHRKIGKHRFFKELLHHGFKDERKTAGVFIQGISTK